MTRTFYIIISSIIAVVLVGAAILYFAFPHYRGTVSQAKEVRSGIIFDLDGYYPNQKMTLFIPRSSETRMAGHWPVVGRQVDVSGAVTQYRGRPEIVVTSPDQIR
jgi:hypothetical protein